MLAAVARTWVRPHSHCSCARAVLAEARMIGSAIAALAPDQQLVDRGGGLLDRAAGDIDNRPMVLGEDSPCLADLGTHRLDIRVIGAFVVIEHAEPIAAKMD